MIGGSILFASNSGMTDMTAQLSRGASATSLLVLLCAGCGKGGLFFPALPPQVCPPAVAQPLKQAAPPAAPSLPTNDTPQAEPAPANDTPAPTVASETPRAETPAAESSQPASDPQDALYSDAFADVQGSIKRKTNGANRSEGPAHTRLIYFFSPMPVDGPLVMQVIEDMTTRGPDGEPGVLALSWQEIPPKLQYSGFVYLGGAAAAGRMTLPALGKAKTSDDLKGLRLTFRFKAAKAGSDSPVKLNVGCRLEPTLPDSYTKRLDLGTFTATDEWGTFEISLQDGTNSEAFLRTLGEENPASFKIVWAQVGPITDYHAGDTLLIDDLKVTRANAE